MALTVGQCRTNPVTGLAGKLYNLQVYGNALGTGDIRSYYVQSAGALTAGARTAIADQCEAMAAWLIEALTVDMAASVSVSAGALQRVPNPATPGADTDAPAAPRTLSVSVT